ncbi:MAG: two-component system, cell cycle sensor histidine kinase and response regulator CckA [Thermoanaerobaculia bacterium]|jgi:PAS domain S-box-containing protein|nr:two-component system, cell cycle sensor histidine kinase and response regulator CckA [Thermoanaerobaculia bacterium]
MFTPEILLNSASQAIVAAGNDGVIVSWNRAAEDLYGWRASDAIGRKLAEVLPTGDPLADPSLIERLRDGGTWSGTRRIVSGSGAASVVLFTASPVRSEDGAVAGLMIVSTSLEEFDLPTLAGAKEQLYREIVDTAQEGIWILNERDETMFANERLASMLGYSANEMLGAPSSQFVVGDGHAIDAQHGERYRAGQSAQLELQLQRRDGTLLSTLLETRPLFRSDGAYRGIRATVIDITARRTGEEESRQRDAQMRDILRTACIAEWGWNIGSDAIEGTAELWEILSLPAKITLAEFLAQSVHPNDRERLAEAFQRTRTEGLPLDVESRLQREGGKEIYIHWRGHNVIDPSGGAGRIVGVIQDVTDRRQLENRLLQAERVSSLGRLAASVAHEFNNVLMGIQPFVDLLTRRAGADPTVATAAPRIADAVARGKRITQEMLRFTRIGEPARATVNVSSWLKEFEPELVQLAGPAVTVAIHAAPSLTMIADAHQLRQVVANLIVNAHHAMPDGGRIEVRATPDVIRDRNERVIDAIHFSISDTGVGMPDETMRYIFEPLFTTRKFGGTGLGLAVAAQVVQQHKGTIYAESALGKGSTFHILIPAGKVATIVSPSPKNSPSSAPDAGTRVTMVEDDEAVGAGLAAILNMEGISVDWVRLGLEAEERIAAKVPDAVILDLGLPDIDGLEVYRQIAQRWPALPVLFSTGHGDEAMLRDVLSEHVAYIQKPYEMSALLAALDKVLGR